jgi:hypothetical protein
MDGITPTTEDVRLQDIRVPEEFWGPGAEPIVQQWLLDNYDPKTMPKLQLFTKPEDRKTPWLIGWHQPPDGFSLLQVIFGYDYAQQRIEQNQAEITHSKATDAVLDALRDDA